MLIQDRTAFRIRDDQTHRIRLRQSRQQGIQPLRDALRAAAGRSPSQGHKDEDDEPHRPHTLLRHAFDSSADSPPA